LRIFAVGPTGNLTLRQVTIIGALPLHGPQSSGISDNAVYVNGGTATITESSISRIPGYSVLTENQGEFRFIQSRISNSGIVGIATNDESRATISGSIVTGLPGFLIRGYGTSSGVSGNASLTNTVVVGNETGVAGSVSLLNSTITGNLTGVSVSFGGSAQLSKV
jgi:hypothetical protein